ncbi:MAG: nucleoside deaminase [Defluviitaleaceae bacterium]|nr:nucleoside deaminase [Defluviitaleaceae bacterium]
MDDNFFMNQAFLEAKKAFDLKEVPIGCVITIPKASIVKKNELSNHNIFKEPTNDNLNISNQIIIGKGFNMRNTLGNTLKHAELIAINEACEKLNDWRLENCTIYVTVEPCAMCAGAILQARIPRLVFGAKNAKAGCAGSVLNILQNDSFNHKVNISQLMEKECGELMSSFFNLLRGVSKSY